VVRSAAQQAAEADGRGLQPCGRSLSARFMVGSRAAAAERPSVGRTKVGAGRISNGGSFFGRSCSGLDPRSSRVDRASPEAVFGGDRGLAHLMPPTPCLGRGHRTCLHRTSKPRGWGTVRLPDVARPRVPRSTSWNRARTSASRRTVERSVPSNAAQQGAAADPVTARRSWWYC
jgi:hypothetical protein